MDWKYWHIMAKRLLRAAKRNPAKRELLLEKAKRAELLRNQCLEALLKEKEHG